MRGRLKTITPKFVEFIPTEGKDLILGIVYISMKHGMVVYRCPCGCGGLSEFMLDPIRFRMEYDGSNVTFHPSIGISYLECRSHYWIPRQPNRVVRTDGRLGIARGSETGACQSDGGPSSRGA